MSEMMISFVMIVSCTITVALLICGLLLKGERFFMIQDATGKEIEVKRGFSFTYFFFGPFVPLVRGHIAGFFLTFFVELFSLGIARIVLLFCYNGMYINWLAANGYHKVDAQQTREASSLTQGRDALAVKKEGVEYQKYNGLIKPVSGQVNQSLDSEDCTVGITTGKVEAVSGVYEGAVIELPYGEQVIIGRDEKSCNLVIDDKEISRKHCEISYDTHQKCYYVTNYSTNGVFLGSGQELKKETSVSLQPGTILQLGRTQNFFLLKE